jgi:hypothetical protein
MANNSAQGLIDSDIIRNTYKHYLYLPNAPQRDHCAVLVSLIRPFRLVAAHQSALPCGAVIGCFVPSTAEAIHRNAKLRSAPNAINCSGLSEYSSTAHAFLLRFQQ